MAIGPNIKLLKCTIYALKKYIRALIYLFYTIINFFFTLVKPRVNVFREVKII